MGHKNKSFAPAQTAGRRAENALEVAMHVAAAGSIFFTRPRLDHHTRTGEEIAKRVDDLFGGLKDGSLRTAEADVAVNVSAQAVYVLGI